MTQAPVLTEREGDVAVIALNAPESLNALSSAMKEHLKAALDQAELDRGVKAIVIAGNGKAFCAGGDLKSFGSRTVLDSVKGISASSAIVLQMSRMEKPIVSAVQGYAMGAGFSLALAADMIVADKSAVFGLSFSKVGLIPDCGCLYWLPRMVGPWKAKELVFNGATLTAEEAKAYGIVNRLASEGEARETAIAMAQQLANGPATAIAFAKTIMAKTEAMTLEETIQYETYAQSILQQTFDHKEGLLAFREKRPPAFKGN